MEEMRRNILEESSKIIEAVKNSLIEVYNPREIFMFGSFVWGTPDSESDIDFAVILDSSELSMIDRMRLATDILWEAGVPIDILVYTKEEIERRAQYPSTLQYRILHEGKKIYEAA